MNELVLLSAGLPRIVLNELRNHYSAMDWYEDPITESWHRVIVYKIPSIVDLLRYRIEYSMYMPSSDLVRVSRSDQCLYGVDLL